MSKRGCWGAKCIWIRHLESFIPLCLGGGLLRWLMGCLLLPMPKGWLKRWNPHLPLPRPLALALLLLFPLNRGGSGYNRSRLSLLLLSLLYRSNRYCIGHDVDHVLTTLHTNG